MLEEMIRHWRPEFGNPHSQNHAWGWRAAQALRKAKEKLAAALYLNSPEEIYFTSGATESLFTVILGWFLRQKDQNPLMATTPIEHKSTQAAFQKIRGWGARVGEVSVDSSGHIVLEELESLCKQGLSFFSFIYAHNEIGTIQKLNKALPLLKSFGVTVHLDLSQAIGKIPVSLRELDIDFASFTAHKFGGPQGVGALYKNLSSKSSLEGLFAGDAEFERLGTPPVALIAGFGKAAELMSQELAGLTSQWTALRQSLLAGLQALDPHLIVNGCPHHHLPHSLSVSLPGLVPHRLAALATTLAVSSGSACISLAPGSATLTALGVPLSLQRQTLRFGLGQNTGPEDIKGALNLLKPVFSGA